VNLAARGLSIIISRSYQFVVLRDFSRASTLLRCWWMTCSSSYSSSWVRPMLKAGIMTVPWLIRAFLLFVLSVGGGFYGLGGFCRRRWIPLLGCRSARGMLGLLVVGNGGRLGRRRILWFLWWVLIVRGC